MRVILAPDKFKDSLSALEVAQHLAAGLRTAHPGLEVELLPVADGSDGTIDALATAGFTRASATVSGPTGESLQADYVYAGNVAVIEMATASGMGVLPGGVSEPMKASSFGTGELILAALDRDCTDIIIGVGGTATTDGGTGMLSALGAVFKDASGRALPPGGGALSQIAHINLSGLDKRLASTKFTLASDVDNPLLGATGSAAIFAPAKGATEQHIAHLEDSLERYFRILANELGAEAVDALDAPGSGAAGGTGYAALAVLKATRRAGIDGVLELTGFSQSVQGAALVITGEGSLDEQTVGDNAVLGVARAAADAGVPIIAVCGRSSLDTQAVRELGFLRSYALTDLEPDTALCMDNAKSLLEEIGAQIGTDFAAHKFEKE